MGLVPLADVNPAGLPSRRLDAVVFSPHKFVGGPGSTGVLIVKRALLTRVTPAQPGGTTTVVGVECGLGGRVFNVGLVADVVVVH